MIVILAPDIRMYTFLGSTNILLFIWGWIFGTVGRIQGIHLLHTFIWYVCHITGCCWFRTGSLWWSLYHPRKCAYEKQSWSEMLSHGSEGLNLGYNYYSLPTIYPPPPYFESKVGRGLILKYLVSLDYTPPRTRGCSEITQWLGCSNLEEQQRHWSCTMGIFPSLLVLPIEEWQQDNGSHQWRQEIKLDWVTRRCVYVFRGQQKLCLLS